MISFALCVQTVQTENIDSHRSYNHRFVFINLNVFFCSEVFFFSRNYPLITPIGRNFIHFLLNPAASHVSTTSVTFLYDSGASSITNFGEATRMAMPRVFIFSRTSLYFKSFRALARDKARPYAEKIRNLIVSKVKKKCFYHHSQLHDK